MNTAVNGTCETRVGEGLRPSTQRLTTARLRPVRESDGHVVPMKLAKAGGGKGPNFWVLVKRPKVRRLA